MRITKDGKKYLTSPGIKLTQEEFINKVQNLHGNIFEFDKLDYKNLISTVTIKCKKHGYFTTIANELFHKHSHCKKCKAEKSLNKFKLNDNFEYDLENYKNTYEPIKIRCKKHNYEFLLSLKNHFLNNDFGGCKICKQENNSLNMKFIISSKTNYKDYDFSNTNFKDRLETVKIYCNIHKKTFTNNLGYILDKDKMLCPDCINEYKIKTFIDKANKQHNNKYDYSNIKTFSSDKKLIIRCPVHGLFEQLQHKHLEIKNSCPRCSGDIHQILNTEEFIKRAKEIHGDKYDYSLVKFINTKTSVDIICKHHGVFKQIPSNHINAKQGCYKCSKSFHVSNYEIKWLNEHRVPLRSYVLCDYNVDGYNDLTNTIYEFLGDYWHGNIERYKDSDLNQTTKKTFGELNKETFERFDYLKKQGYNIIYIWELDWLNGNKEIRRY